MNFDTISTLSGADAKTKSTAATSKLSADYDSFLQLLTAQVANQDPLAPMDSTTFVSQLAQLSQVEQSIQTNANLEQISSRLAASGALADMALIGRQVTLPSDTLNLAGGTAEFGYELAADAAIVGARITTADGTVVRELSDLPRSGGKLQTVAWDGRNNAGELVADGNYSIEIRALTNDETPVSVSTFTSALVEKLSFDTGQPILTLSNGETAHSGQVMAVSARPAL
jgi:flagellar basal-body rod modification protein FlgD